MKAAEINFEPASARPPWLKVRRLSEPVRALIRESVGATATVCKEANCPNIGECWARGTATYMIMGDTCTRNCAFCDVAFGKPRPLDPAEPARVAASVAGLGLKYAVMTCVDRDDLPDSGAAHWAATIEAVRASCGELRLDHGLLAAAASGALKLDNGERQPGRPADGSLWSGAYLSGAGIEILTGDFKGVESAIEAVAAARPQVFAHNVEVVPRLQRIARHKATWERSLHVLDIARAAAAQAGHVMFTKTGLMLGLGESIGEVKEALGIIRARGVDLITIGQYLKPRAVAGKLEMQRFVTPDEFAELREHALAVGFAGVAASPLTRSSYLAETLYARALVRSFGSL